MPERRTTTRIAQHVWSPCQKAEIIWSVFALTQIVFTDEFCSNGSLWQAELDPNKRNYSKLNMADGTSRRVNFIRLRRKKAKN